MDLIHPDATVHPSAYIGPYVLIGPKVTIRAHVRIEGFASIGTAAEIRGRMSDPPGLVEIERGVVIREYCTVNGGTGSTWTKVGVDSIMLRGSHVGHDAVIEEGVTLSCNVMVGGGACVMNGANCGLGSLIHQGCVVGSYAMLGMGCVVTKKSTITPGNTYVGMPARLLGINRRGILGLRGALLDSEMKRYLELTG